ncbi:hypothetical protein T492DRAFT_1081269 [Pavlovales sp. CCMP2436]|nr:hypothetical protein T492DRAFT_1081269 [Pavlovales sp. CCMP2436]
MQIALVALVAASLAAPSTAAHLARRFAARPLALRAARTRVRLAEKDPAYENPLLALVGRLLPAGSGGSGRDKGEALSPALAAIDWDASKAPERDLRKNAARLEAALARAEWFVTGKIEPRFFSDAFVFKDPDVTLTGVQAYASGVSRLFDQRSARAEIARVRVRDADSAIEVAWRLSGGVTIGPLELDLKPYLVLTDLVVDQSGLVVYQEDTFSIPGWDILLSALFPALRPLLAPEAPPIAELRARLAAEP